jgi:murein DD-endopeptidase MepM/ murein hydrolase activator NlpD
MNISDETLQVNKFARRSRHLRVFSKAVVIKSYAFEFLSFLASPFPKIWENSTTLIKTRKFFSQTRAFISDLFPTSPQKRLFSQAIFLSIGLVLATSITTSGSFIASSMTYSSTYMDSYSFSGDILVSDEYGYIVKTNPQTHTSNRIGLTDYAVHTVASGESLSVIAGQYGLSADTIKWENNLGNVNSIRAGQVLLVPPVDGIGYTVKRGDTLGKITQTYKVSVESVIAQNNLSSDTIAHGQKLFLPGAKPLAPPPVIAQNSVRNTTVTRDVRAVGATSAAPASAVPVGGRSFIYPTRGLITQGYRAGHYALDIADRSRPPVWSAASGTVVTASAGTWAGGYGNHVVVDHGNGLKTLYAHLGSVNVSSGQWVNQGDVLGMMGNTGRVYGSTGIHLHWEVHLNGVRQNPRNYY